MIKLKSICTKAVWKKAKGGQHGYLVETAVLLIVKAYNVLSVGNFVHHKDGFATVSWLIFSRLLSTFYSLNISNSLPVTSSGKISWSWGIQGISTFCFKGW